MVTILYGHILYLDTIQNRFLHFLCSNFKIKRVNHSSCETIIDFLNLDFLKIRRIVFDFRINFAE